MAGRKSFVLRVDAELYAALQRWANDELRSVNGQIEYVLREALRRTGRLSRPLREENPAMGDSLSEPAADDHGA